MATSTLVGPTQTQQINNDLYVGPGFLQTIQEAVNFAAAEGGSYRVIIPAGYAGSDTIGAVTGGTSNIHIEDQRGVNPTCFEWNGTAYFGPMVAVNGYLQDGGADLFLNGSQLLIGGQPHPTTPGDGGANNAALTFSAGDGQTTTGTTGQTAGPGAPFLMRGGNGGNAPAGSTNGAGGNVTIYGGPAGTGAGAKGTPGYVAINAAGPGVGQTIIGYNTNGATVIDPAGNLSAPNLSTPSLTAADADVTGTLTANAATISNLTAADADVTGTLTADAADFTTCDVAGSPVRTFANTPAGGIPYPGVGIGLSTGTAWGTSIDPATLALKASLATVATSGSYADLTNKPTIPPAQVYPGAGIGVSTGTAWGTSINPSTLATFPPAGLANSTGSAWGTPITITPVANALTKWVSATNLGSSQLTEDASGNLTTLGTVTCKGATVNGRFDTTFNTQSMNATANGGLSVVWNLNSTQEVDFVCSHQPSYGGFNWYQALLGGAVVATTPVMKLDALGNLTAKGTTTTTGLSTVGQGTSQQFGSVTSSHSSASSYPILSLGGSIKDNGDGTNTVLTDGASNFFSLIRMDNTGINFFSAASTGGTTYNLSESQLQSHKGMGLDTSGTLTLNNLAGAAGAEIASFLQPAASSGTTFIGVGQNTAGCAAFGYNFNFASVLIGVNNGAGFVTIDGPGNLKASGTITGSAKNFQIVHPLDDTKHLTHGCIEGPELAVFYRGEGVTGEDGAAVIELPDYFEALTRPEGRTVHLTELIEDDDDRELGKLAASRVKAGQFRVRSEYTATKFYWEVKAIRADVAPLVVVSEREDNHTREPK
jgi:hypothetical protein